MKMPTSFLLLIAVVSLIQCNRIESADPTKEFFEAVALDDKQRAEELLPQGPNVNTTDHEGRTPLMWAAALGNNDIVEMLLGAEANINAADHDCLTALMWAACLKHETAATIVAALLEKEATVDATELRNWTALMYAAYFGNEEVAILILEAEADREKQAFSTQKTAEQLARDNRHFKLADIIRDWNPMVKSAAKS